VSELLLDVSRMREAHDRIERTFPPEALDLSGDLFRLAGPVWLAFDITKDKDQFRLAGRVRTALALLCGRCLEPFSLPVDEAFDLLYLPHAAQAGEGELEIEDEDLTTAYYHNQLIDLGQLMQEQCYLAVPMKPLCRDGCRGLCAMCGTNLNAATCDCRPTWEDPRLAGLRHVTTNRPPRT
jgi:uncharacterized protein